MLEMCVNIQSMQHNVVECYRLIKLDITSQIWKFYSQISQESAKTKDTLNHVILQYSKIVY